MEIRGPLSRSAIDTFLESSTIPVRLACERPDGSPWMLSLWYRYRHSDSDRTAESEQNRGQNRNGYLECATAADAAVVTFLEHNPSVAFEVSTNDPPYKGVRGNGTATVRPDSDKDVLRALLNRYLGSTENTLAQRLLEEHRDEVTIRIDLETVYGWDFSDRMADVVSDG